MGIEMDWSAEWVNSLVWIAGVFVAATLGSAVLAALLSRYTVWGRQFRRLAFPYFSPRGPEGWRPLLRVLLVLLLAVASVRAFSWWRSTARATSIRRAVGLLIGFCR